MGACLPSVGISTRDDEHSTVNYIKFVGFKNINIFLPEQHTAMDQERQQRDDELPGDVVQCIQQQQRQSLQRRVHCCQRSSSAESGSEH